MRPHLRKERKGFLAVRTEEGLFICCMGLLMLAELLRVDEVPITFVANEQCISLQGKNEKIQIIMVKKISNN